MGRDGFAGTLARVFVKSPLTLLVVVVSMLLGVFAIVVLPREEEPQIKVPMIDVMVSMPGASAREVEDRVTKPMEKLLWEIPGVEYVYSTSSTDRSTAIVRFKVGENPDDSLAKLTQKLQSNYDRIPQGVSFPMIKARSIDDVPILALTFHSTVYDHLTLRRIAVQVEDYIKAIPNVAETTVIGGAKRQVRVLLDTERIASRSLSVLELTSAIQQANKQYTVGTISNNNKEITVETGGFLRDVEDVKNVVVGVYAGIPVYLHDVATIEDSSEELSQYVFFGDAEKDRVSGNVEPAVTLSIAKRPGTNAVALTDTILNKLELLRPSFLPNDVEVTVTRNYGQTAADKSDELLFHMLLAVVGVSLLILLVLGWRESLVVAIAIPTTLALTLLVFYLYGYTLNRITLFALIFSIGILVDDAIVVIENVVRCAHLPENHGKNFSEVVIFAVSEVGNPTVLATFAVIAAILPMAFVGGLMGPYMRPIPVGATAAMAFSLLVAFIVTPWAALKLMAAEQKHAASTDDWFTRVYRRIMGPMIEQKKWRWAFLIGTTTLLLFACSFVWFEWVQVKMLPFDNKSEFQVILNMPESSSLEKTTQVAKEMAEVISEDPTVKNYQLYAGVAAPYNFSGLVRHYFLRSGPNVADIQVNLVGKEARSIASHEIAKRIRAKIRPIADKYQGRIAVAEVPPGPPVLQTLVAEVYGADEVKREDLATRIKKIMGSITGIVDIDWYVESPARKMTLVIDKEKAALHGISSETISNVLRVALGGLSVDLLHDLNELEDIDIRLEIAQNQIARSEDLLAIKLKSGISNQSDPKLVPLSELVKVEDIQVERSIYHKNMMPVTYVIADVAGAIESPVYAISELNTEIAKIDATAYGAHDSKLTIYNATLPQTDLEPSLKWDGEWHITLEVFRDLGLAFIAVLILIYFLMVGWFSSYITPIVVMAAIPFSLIGILPAHALAGAFFTATSMIGFMAGAGIVVRNSIILVDFIEERIREGQPLAMAVVEAGAVRFRPMMLTAMAVVVGAGVILFDPIFQGLAISLIAGEIASLIISRMAVPVLYFMVSSCPESPLLANLE